MVSNGGYVAVVDDFVQLRKKIGTGDQIFNLKDAFMMLKFSLLNYKNLATLILYFSVSLLKVSREK